MIKVNINVNLYNKSNVLQEAASITMNPLVHTGHNTPDIRHTGVQDIRHTW